MSEKKSLLVKVRDKGEITLPIELREKMKITTGTLLKVNILNSSQFCLHKIIPHKAPNNNIVGGGDEIEKVGSA